MALFLIAQSKNIHNTVKKVFPFFRCYPSFYFFDSAATTLKPKAIILAIKKGYTIHTLPANKSLYFCAEETFKNTEIKAKKLIHSLTKSKNYTIFFGFSVTSLFDRLFFLIFFSFHQKKIHILLHYTVHTSITTPLEKYYKDKIEFHFYKNETVETINQMAQTCHIIIFAMTDHITGHTWQAEIINDFKKKNKDKIVIIDASQSFAISAFKPILIDIIVWSSHKMYGPDSVAIIMMNESILNRLKTHPIIQHSSHNLNNEFKSGSFSYASLFAYTKTISWIKKYIYNNPRDKIEKKKFITSIYEVLEKKNNIQIVSSLDSFSIVTFFHKTIHAHDIAEQFSFHNIGIRSGDLCAYNQISHTGLIRISLGIYNEKTDIDYLIKIIHIIFP